MPDTDNKTDPVALIKSAVGELKNDLSKQLEDKVSNKDAEALNKKVADLEAQIKEVSIKTKDKELEDPYLGLFKKDADFFVALLSANGSRTQHGMDRQKAHDLIYGDKGYLKRVNELCKAVDGFNEAQDADGAIFLVPQIASGLLSTEPQLSNFSSQAMNVPMGGLTWEINALVDKNHNTSVAGGVTVSRKPEGTSPGKSKAAFEKVALKVTKQAGYTDITEEALADIPALASFIPMLFAKAFRVAEEQDFLYEGSGAGEPLAALHANNPALITIDEESGQAADTIVLENLLKMRARVVDYGSAYWYATQDIIPQIATITLGNAPIFLPSGTQDVPDRILGRPVVFTEYASALGDLNDIALVAPKHYVIGTRQGVTSQSSIHVRFLQGETTMRFVKRNDGQPLWKSALTPNKGNTRSPFVNLSAR